MSNEFMDIENVMDLVFKVRIRVEVGARIEVKRLDEHFETISIIF